MGNPRPDLQGWADRESVPGWQQEAIARVVSRQKVSGRADRRKSGLYLFFDDPYRVHLDAAAHQRDISLAGYLRRAGAAFMSQDLGIDFEDIVQHAAQPTPYGITNSGFKRGKTVDDGEGFGEWRILGLAE